MEIETLAEDHIWLRWGRAVMAMDSSDDQMETSKVNY